MRLYNAFFVIPFLFSTSAMSAVTPRITEVSVTPTSAKAGTNFEFLAQLDTSLPTGYKVKIDTGNKVLTAMVGTGIKYKLSKSIYTTGTSTYKVGIYNIKGVLQGTVSSGSYTVTSASPINHAPTLSIDNAKDTAEIATPYSCPTGTSKIVCDSTATFYNALNGYFVTLNAKDVDANLSSITMDWGDGTLLDTKAATDGLNTLSHNYKTAGTFVWNAYATDKGQPVLSSLSVSKTITVSEPVVEVTPPLKTTGYTKISNNGSELPDSAILGANSKDWACTKDNDTGLIWEVKTTNGGLRDMYNTYSWYEADANKNNGKAGTKNGGKCKGSECDTYAYTHAVNEQGLCGSKDWRMPTKDELSKLILCSDGDQRDTGECRNYTSVTRPTIDSISFPNTPNQLFWTESAYTSQWFTDVACCSYNLNFGTGSGNVNNNKKSAYAVRLVRGIAKLLSSTDCGNGQILNANQTACIDKPIIPSNTSSSKCDLPFTSITVSDMKACEAAPCTQPNQYNQTTCSNIYHSFY